MATIAILGAGVMGSAMVFPLHDRGHRTWLVGTPLDQGIIESVVSTSFHPRLAVEVPKSVQALPHRRFKEAADDCEMIVLGVSSAGVEWAIAQLCETLTRPVPIVMITKGMQPEGKILRCLPDHVQAEVRARTGLELPMAAIAGPCIAGELAVRRHTGTVIVSRDPELAGRLCTMLEAEYYHPRASSDMEGVEICAAFKNFFAIAVGWAAGHAEKIGKGPNGALNHNAAATIFDQAIAELMVLARHFGGSAKSVWGMPGAGDLYVTCQAGRNSRLGRHLGLGLSYADVKAGPMKEDTVEGAELGIAVAPTLRSLMASGELDQSSLPITCALLSSLTGNVPLAIAWQDFHRGKS